MYRIIYSGVIISGVQRVIAVFFQNGFQRASGKIVFDAAAGDSPAFLFGGYQHKDGTVVLIFVANAPLIEDLIGILLRVQIIQKIQCHHSHLTTAGVGQGNVLTIDVFFCLGAETTGIIHIVYAAGGG